MDLEREKYIGLALAVTSSLAIGTSFIITKKGLISAADDGFSSDSYSYLRNSTWWAGMILSQSPRSPPRPRRTHSPPAAVTVGEIANFAAYTFAPPILVTPLGALSVLIGSVISSIST